MARKLKDVKADRAAATPADAETAVAALPKLSREVLDERQMILIGKAIADPRRMSILRSIAQKTSACAEMRACMPISAATLSHHMKELETAGLITTTKDGRFVSATLQKKVWKSYVAALKALTD